MKIEEIRVKNFRSFGEEIVLLPKPELNIIIGENNVGKSNIFIALDKLKQALIYGKDFQRQGNVFHSKDWYCSKYMDEEEIEIDVLLILKEKELNELISLFFSTIEAENKEKLIDLKEELGNRIKISLRYKYKKSSPHYYSYYEIYFKVGNLILTLDGRASIKPESFNLSSSQYQLEAREWINIIKEYFNKKTKLLDIITHKFEGKNNSSVMCGEEIANFIIQLFYKKLKLFKDIRQRPIGKSVHESIYGKSTDRIMVIGDENVYESLGGEEVADVLFTLKNSDDPIERDKYKLIQKKFTELFPTLNLEVVKDKGTKKLDIHINRVDIKHELPMESMGTGIMEMVIFLTNIIASKDNIFVIEEPELHLHPSSQRLFLDLLNEYKKDNQFFIISHSPYFIDIKNIANNILLKIRNGKSIVKQISDDYFDTNNTLKIEKNLDSENREMFFSRAVLLVEGPTEKRAFPIFAKAIDKDFDKNNIFTCCVYGKGSFSIFQKILDGFDIPYCIVCDKDAKSIKINENKLFVLSPDFEGVLKNEGYGDLLEEVKKEVGEKSKPIIGKIIAKRIIKLKSTPEEAIPSIFIEAIEKVINLTK